MEKTFKICLNFTADIFVFGCINSENAPRNLFVNLAGKELLKCAGTSQQTASFLDAKIASLRKALVLIVILGK